MYEWLAEYISDTCTDAQAAKFAEVLKEAGFYVSKSRPMTGTKEIKRNGVSISDQQWADLLETADLEV